MSQENPCVDLEKIVVVPRMSQYEFDRRMYELGHDGVMEKYRSEGSNGEEIFASHKRQQESLETLKKFFKENQFVPAEKFTKEKADLASLVIALGGDDHIKFVSHFIDDALVMGVNSDPVLSEGALTYFTAKNFEDVIRNLSNGYFNVENWTRLEATINGHKIPRAISEYFLGERERMKMSGYRLTIGKDSERQKSSGLLVVTGAGSTGWYNSACRYVYPNGNPFPKEQSSARYLGAELYHGQLTGYKMLEGVLEPEQELIVHSFNKHNGIISPDSIGEFSFPRGSTAIIKISDKPLKVIGRMV